MENINEVEKKIDNIMLDRNWLYAKEIIEENLSREDITMQEEIMLKRKLMKVYRKTGKFKQSKEIEDKISRDKEIPETEKLKVKCSLMTTLIYEQRRNKNPNFTEAKDLGNSLLTNTELEDAEKPKIISKLISIAIFEERYKDIDDLVEKANKISTEEEMYVIRSQIMDSKIKQGNYKEAIKCGKKLLKDIQKGEDSKKKRIGELIINQKISEVITKNYEEYLEQINPENFNKKRNSVYNSEIEQLDVLKMVKEAKTMEELILAMEVAKKNGIETIVKQCSSFIKKKVATENLSDKDKRILNACNQILMNKKGNIDKLSWDKVYNMILQDNKNNNNGGKNNNLQQGEEK